MKCGRARIPTGAARVLVSLWDVKAFQEIIAGVQKFREGIQNTLQDVSFLNSDGFHNKDPKVCESILAKTNQSICGIGSMRSSIATEIMLSIMFQISPFAKARRRLPFQFIWPEDADRRKWGFASALHCAYSTSGTYAYGTNVAPVRRGIVKAESVLIIDPQFKGTMAPMVDGSSVGSAISPGTPAALCANESGADG
jgi:hypothetical protein